MQYVMRTTFKSERLQFINDAKDQIPELEMCSSKGNAMDTFLLSLKMVGDNSCINMEDDIELCEDFKRNIENAISQNEDKVIQFFSMRKDDLKIGSRFIAGRKFLMGQCFYLPKGIAKEMLEYSKIWGRFEEHPTGLDILIADYLGDNRLKYFNFVPSLVQHHEVESIINPKRSKKRQSITFRKKI